MYHKNLNTYDFIPIKINPFPTEVRLQFNKIEQAIYLGTFLSPWGAPVHLFYQRFHTWFAHEGEIVDDVQYFYTPFFFEKFFIKEYVSE